MTNTPDPYSEARHTRTAVQLRAASAFVAVLFVAFTPYNFWMLEAPGRWLAVAHDLTLVGLGATLAFLLSRDRLPHAWADPIGAALSVWVAVNIGLVQVLNADPVHLFYQALLMCSMGLVLTRMDWASLALATILSVSAVTYALTWPVDHRMLSVGFAHFAVALMALALVVGRGWYTDHLTELMLRDRAREVKLRDALKQANEAERRLDAKVARRTSQLRRTNEALRLQIEAGRKASHDKEDLSRQLLHAQRIDAIGQRTASVVHHLNNLLTAIVGNVELAGQEADDNSEATEALDQARSSAHRAAELAQQLLVFSRTDAAGQVVDVHEAFQGLASMVARLLGEDVHLEIVPCSEPLGLGIAPLAFDQVLLNLLVNARDAMPDGGNIRVRARRDGQQALVEVLDEGVGISEADQARIFDAFYTTKPAGKGSGLGLATVRTIVSTHGGTIGVRSAPGVGTTFEIRLPLVDMEAGPRPSIPPVRVPQGRGELVLVVEHEESVRRIAVRMLERLNYRTIDAGSGDEALRLLALEGHIDLLWTDVLMPGMDGRELAERVQAIQPDVPVLLASGYSGDLLAPRGVLAEGTNFLPKPYDAGDVARAVRQALDR